MTTKELAYRGYNNFAAFFFDLMVKSRSGAEAPQDMFKELEGRQRGACLEYLLEQAEAKDADAILALKAIAKVI